MAVVPLAAVACQTATEVGVDDDPALTVPCAVVGAEHPQEAETNDYRQPIQSSDVSFEMVWIEEGGFWIGRHEVTWDEYLLYCHFELGPVVPPDADAVSKPSKPLETFPYDREWGTGRRPAVGMSWNAAQRYCEWISQNTGLRYRLPTEAEWRLACGDTPPADALDRYAWYDDNSDDMTHEVGSKEPNAHGLYDMFGNLWEYTADAFDPEEPEFAALRGGSWADPASDASADARLQFDDFWTLADPNVPPGVWWVPDGDHLGFRLLRCSQDDAANAAQGRDDGSDGGDTPHGAEDSNGEERP